MVWSELALERLERRKINLARKQKLLAVQITIELVVVSEDTPCKIWRPLPAGAAGCRHDSSARPGDNPGWPRKLWRATDQTQSQGPGARGRRAQTTPASTNPDTQ